MGPGLGPGRPRAGGRRGAVAMRRVSPWTARAQGRLARRRDRWLRPPGTPRPCRSAWHVVVHAGRQAALAVALHRVGGHGDDRHARRRRARAAGSRRSPRGRPSRASARPSAPRRTARGPGVDRLAAVCHDATSWPRSQEAHRELWLTGLSSASRMRTRRPAAAGATRPHLVRGAGDRAHAARPCSMASSRSDCLTGLVQIRARCPASRQRDRHRGCPPTEHHDRGDRAGSAFSRMSRGEVEAVHLRHVDVEQHQR